MPPVHRFGLGGVAEGVLFLGLCYVRYGDLFILVFVFFWLWTVAEAIVGGGRLLAGVPGGWVCMESQV